MPYQPLETHRAQRTEQQKPPPPARGVFGIIHHRHHSIPRSARKPIKAIPPETPHNRTPQILCHFPTADIKPAIEKAKEIKRKGHEKELKPLSTHKPKPIAKATRPPGFRVSEETAGCGG